MSDALLHRPMKILIVKLSSLGDVIQTTPVVQDLHRCVSNASIDWVVEEGFADLLSRVQGLDRVIPCAQRRWRKTPFASDTRRAWHDFWQTLQAQSYDAVIDFQGLIKSAYIARGAKLTPSGFSVTYGNASDLCAYEWPVKWMLKQTVTMEKTIHAVARYRTLAARALGYENTGVLGELPAYPFAIAPVGQRRGVMLAHGTTRLDNEWPFEHWLGLSKRIIAQGDAVYVPQASERELAFAQRLLTQLGDGVHVLPRLSLAQVCDEMAQCKGVVSVDSGLGHLAVALNLPVVQLFSQPRIQRAGPVGVAHQCAIGGDHVPSVEQAWHAWQHCLEALP